MTRPCFLVIDREYAGSISTRKLVIETAKLNVITAYSAAEAIATLGRFPALDGVVLDAGVPDMPCAAIVSELKKIQPSIPVVVIGTPTTRQCDGAEHFLDSFEPVKLLGLLARIVPGVTALRDDEEKLSRDTR